MGAYILPISTSFEFISVKSEIVWLFDSENPTKLVNKVTASAPKLKQYRQVWNAGMMIHENLFAIHREAKSLNAGDTHKAWGAMLW